MERGERLAWIGFGIAAAAAYVPVVVRLTAAWWTDSDYSHGLICAPLAAALIYGRRDALAKLPMKPAIVGLAGAGASLVLLLVGTLGAELFLTRTSLLLFAASSIVFLFGWRHLRAVAFPFAIVALSIPIPAILMTHVTLPLQFAASAAAEASLTAVGIPVLREGNVLALPHATLQVAEACSGVRSMMSLIVLGLIVARRMESRTAVRAAIVAAAVPVTIAVNAFRVTATALVTERYGVAAAEGLVHEMLGTLLFVASAILLIACARVVIALAARTSPLRAAL